MYTLGAIRIPRFWLPVTAVARNVIVLMLLVSGLCRAQQTGGSATIAGVVRDSVGTAVRGAEIVLDSTERRVRSDAEGRYRLDSVPVGRVSVVVRRLGFRPGAGSVVTRSGLVTQLDFALQPSAQRLAAVVVAERRTPSDARLAGFNRRKDDKIGYFIGREKLDRGPSRLTELLREVPGVRLVGVSRGGSLNGVRLRGASCPPVVFLDGYASTVGEFDLGTVDPSSLEGVEIYASMTLVPAELQAPRNLDRCGVIALWSRPAPGRAVERLETVTTDEAVDLARLIAAEQVFTAEEVDSVAHLVEADVVAPYPDELWRAGTSGRAVVEFVVSASGEVEMATFGIISASHPLFAAAAREALSGAAFVPAVAGRRRVRQVVQMPFEFRRPSEPDSRGRPR